MQHSTFVVQRSLSLSLVTIFFEKEGIQKNGSTHEHGLFVNRRLFRKGNDKGIGIRKDLRGQTFWFLEDFANKRRVPARLGLSGRIDSKWDLAAAFATRIAFGAAIHAATTTASGRMNLVESSGIRLGDGQGRHTVVAIFLDLTQELSTTSDGNLLVAAALAAARGTLERTIHREQLRFRLKFLDAHLEGMNGRAKYAAAAVRVF